MPTTSKACASCRHQRKRCDGGCPYAELFPASRFDEFQNAQRLFGVTNIHNIVNSIDPELRKQAAESILTEGNIRRGDPVHGCLGVVRRLKWEIKFCEEQLEYANRCLSFLRQRDQELKRQRQGFNNTLVELPPLPPSFFSNGGGGGSFYGPIRSTPATTLLDSSHMNYQGLSYQSTYEEGTTSIQPFNSIRAPEPWNGNPAAAITRADQIARPAERGAENVGLCLKGPDFRSHGDRDR